MEALKDAFPELRFEVPRREPPKVKDYWRDIQHCRVFFDDFAKERNFSPLDANNWYAIELSDMLAKKVIGGLGGGGIVFLEE